jgi:tetraacyldisaccharide 4'-kinase
VEKTVYPGLMTGWKILLNRVIRTPEESTLQRVLLAPLGLLSFFYGWILRARVSLYHRGIFKAHSIPCKVISVGNITLGGTGKTPFVGLLAEMIQGRGIRTAILSRGYGGEFQGSYGLVSDGEKVFMDAAQAGDEPFLLAQKLDGIPVIVGRERRVSGQWAVDRFQPEVVILDDGFQHLSLKRNLNLLLIDSSCPFGNGKIFPRGILREPLDQISRADAVILTKAVGNDNISKLNEKISNLAGEIPVFRAYYEAVEIRAWEARESLPLERLRGRKVLAFSGIAHPDSFRETLLGLKAEIGGLEIFPDHYEYGRQDMDRLQDRASGSGAEAMVTTEKDLVRLKNLAPGPIPVWAISVRHVFPVEDRARFESFLWGGLGLNS